MGGNSKWKKRDQNGWIFNRRFSKQMGVSIAGFENQCYSLLRCIDEERMKKLKESGP